jgi:hypothetical protein
MQGLRVKEVMSSEYKVVSPETSLQEFMDDHFVPNRSTLLLRGRSWPLCRLERIFAVPDAETAHRDRPLGREA